MQAGGLWKSEQINSVSNTDVANLIEYLYRFN